MIIMFDNRNEEDNKLKLQIRFKKQIFYSSNGLSFIYADWKGILSTGV